MRNVYHYTSMGNYKKIRKEGVLHAISPLIPHRWQDSLHMKIPENTFLFAFLDTPRPKGWTETYLLDHLIKKSYRRCASLALLRFPLNEEQSSFVLEAKFLYDLLQQELSPKRAFTKYVQSMTELQFYKGNFELPELVLTHSVPIDMITLEAIL